MDQRLAFCQPCERFVCPVCWVADRGICRACLMPGQATGGRMRLEISRTFMPTSVRRLQPRQPAVAEPPPASITGGRRALPRRRASVVGMGTLAMILVIVGAAVVRPAPDPGVEPAASGDAVREAVLPGRASASPAPAAVVHVVEPGDTLIDLARRFYRDESAWPRIHEANREQLADPDVLVPGQRLVIPSPSAQPDP